MQTNELRIVKKYYLLNVLTIIYLIYIHKQDLAFNNLHWLICHKSSPKHILIYIYILKICLLYLVIDNFFKMSSLVYHQVLPTARISLILSLSIHLYHPSFLAGLPNCTPCPHKADVNKFFLERPWMFVLLGWVLKWDVSGCTAVISWCAASRILM